MTTPGRPGATHQVEEVAGGIGPAVVELMAPNCRSGRSERGIAAEGGLAVAELQPVGHRRCGIERTDHGLSVEPTRQPQEPTALGPGRKAALDRGGRDKAPKAAARAQVMYDCWVEEEEEAWQKDRIAYCKGEFEKALAEVERALAPAPAPAAAAAPAPAAPANFIVYFDFNSDKLNPAALKVVDDAAAEFKKRGRATITLAGHTDKSGSSAYNQRLSKRRADAVLSAMVARGVPANIVTEQAFGEDRPAVPTADGVKEARNRRVEITIR